MSDCFSSRRIKSLIYDLGNYYRIFKSTEIQFIKIDLFIDSKGVISPKISFEITCDMKPCDKRFDYLSNETIDQEIVRLQDLFGTSGRESTMIKRCDILINPTILKQRTLRDFLKKRAIFLFRKKPHHVKKRIGTTIPIYS